MYGIRPHMFHLWADDMAEGVKMQHRRLTEAGLPCDYQTRFNEAELADQLDIMNVRTRNDFDFYFIALRRLLRVAEAAAEEGYGGDGLKSAIAQFDNLVPGLRGVRDSAEHADDWLRTGRTRSFGMTIGGNEEDAIFTHGQDKFFLRKTTKAAHDLYDAIRSTVPAGAPNIPGPPLLPGESDRAVREATWLAERPSPHTEWPEADV